MKRRSSLGFQFLVVAFALFAPQGAQPAQGEDWGTLTFQAKAKVAVAAGKVTEEEEHVVAARAAWNKAKANIPPPGEDPSQYDQKVDAANKNLDNASQGLTRATNAYTNAKDDYGRLRNEAAKSGVILPDEKGSLLGPSHPMKITLGSKTILEELDKYRLPLIRGGQGNRAYDGEGLHTQALSTTEVQSFFGTTVLVLDAKVRAGEEEQAAREQAAREQAAREQAARAATEQAARAATEQAARAFEDRKAALRTAINRHIENGRNGNYSSVESYNAMTDGYIRRWKELTGEDLTYKFYGVER